MQRSVADARHGARDPQEAGFLVGDPCAVAQAFVGKALDPIARLVTLPTGAVLIQLTGEIDMAVDAALRDQLLRAVRISSEVLVDMSSVAFLDCTALGGLMLAQERAVADGGGVVLIAPPRNVQRLLDLVGATDVLPVYADLQSALLDAEHDRNALHGEEGRGKRPLSAL